MHHCIATLWILYRCDDVLRFVEGQIDVVLGRLQTLAVELNLIGFKFRLRTQLSDGAAIHRHSPGKYQLLRLSPAGYTGMRKNFL